MISSSFKKGIIIAACVTMMLGKVISLKISLLSIVLFVIAIILNDNLNNYGIVLLLAPCLRIYDNLGFMSVVNILMLIPIVIEVIRSKKMTRHVFITTFILCSMELFHIFLNGEINSVFSNLACIIPYYFCATLIGRHDNSDANILAHYLAYGVIISSISYILYNKYTLSILIHRAAGGHRFAAFANDPNYFSMYILLAFSIIIFSKSMKKTDYFILIALVLFSLLTLSKMCLILLVLCLTVYFWDGIFMEKNKMRILTVAIALAIILFINWNTLQIFIEAFIKRSGIGSDDFTLNRLTTNRYSLIIEYIGVLLNNPVVLVLGSGLNYPAHFNVSLNHDFSFFAHNTYLDLILSWGIVGVIVMCGAIKNMISPIVQNNNEVLDKKNCIPLVIFSLMCMGLSCLSAEMFWFVFSLSILQIKKGREYKNNTYTIINKGCVYR